MAANGKSTSSRKNIPLQTPRGCVSKHGSPNTSERRIDLISRAHSIGRSNSASAFYDYLARMNFCGGRALKKLGWKGAPKMMNYLESIFEASDYLGGALYENVFRKYGTQGFMSEWTQTGLVDLENEDEILTLLDYLSEVTGVMVVSMSHWTFFVGETDKSLLEKAKREVKFLSVQRGNE